MIPNFLVWTCLILGTIAFSCIIWGPITASMYVTNRNIRNSHTNTTCLLMDYEVVEHECTICDFVCSTYKCFDEILFLSYSILNGSHINATTSGYKDRREQLQRQVRYFSREFICMSCSFI